jgi:hypothetical protein
MNAELRRYCTSSEEFDSEKQTVDAADELCSHLINILGCLASVSYG